MKPDSAERLVGVWCFSIRPATDVSACDVEPGGKGDSESRTHRGLNSGGRSTDRHLTGQLPSEFAWTCAAKQVNTVTNARTTTRFMIIPPPVRGITWATVDSQWSLSTWVYEPRRTSCVGKTEVRLALFLGGYCSLNWMTSGTSSETQGSLRRRRRSSKTARSYSPVSRKNRKRWNSAQKTAVRSSGFLAISIASDQWRTALSDWFSWASITPRSVRE